MRYGPVVSEVSQSHLGRGGPIAIRLGFWIGVNRLHVELRPKTNAATDREDAL